MNEEKIMILEMLDDEKITAQEAIKLLEALDGQNYKIAETKFTNKSLEEIGTDISNAFSNLIGQLKLARRGNMSQETLEILYMVRDGRMSPEEGERLLNALGTNEDMPRDNKAQFIKIRVRDSDGSDKVNVTLPVSLLSTGIKLAEKFNPEFKASGLTKSDMDNILLAVKSGEKGKIIDVEKDSGERVEITIT